MHITADSIGIYTKVFSLSPHQNFDVIRQWSVQWCLMSGPSCLMHCKQERITVTEKQRYLTSTASLDKVNYNTNEGAALYESKDNTLTRVNIPLQYMLLLCLFFFNRIALMSGAWSGPACQDDALKWICIVLPTRVRLNNIHTFRIHYTLRACCSQSKFRILKIRESTRALFLYNCTPNISRSADTSVSVAFNPSVGLIYFLNG